MTLMKRLFGGGKPTATSHPSQGHSQLAMSQTATRRESLRLALRDTLQRHGIPAEWIGGETFTTASRSGERTLHWRLIVKHWDPRLLTHGVALQHALVKRLTAFDPLAAEWLNGISWQFALEDESACPPMPAATLWTAPEPVAPRVAPALPVQADGVLIEGPVRIAEATQPADMQEADSPRADLDRLFAIRDADFRRNEGEQPSPAWSRTEPAKL